jgi:hypothetical protein
MGQHFHVGDYVRVVGVPPSVTSLLEESRRIFSRAVGQVLRVDEIEAYTIG